MKTMASLLRKPTKTPVEYWSGSVRYWASYVKLYPDEALAQRHLRFAQEQLAAARAKEEG